MVLNDTRVLPARLHGHKESGGACELLLERILDGNRILAQARSSKGLRPGTTVTLPAGAVAVAIARHGDLWELALDRDALPYFEEHGSIPLPPYVARAADDDGPRALPDCLRDGTGCRCGADCRTALRLRGAR